MDSILPIHTDYALGFDHGDALKQPVRSADDAVVLVHWVFNGRVTHTTQELWDTVRPLVSADINAIIHAGEVWWSDDGNLQMRPPR